MVQAKKTVMRMHLPFYINLYMHFIIALLLILNILEQ